MLQLSYVRGSGDKKYSPVPAEQLDPDGVYTLFEQYAGGHERGGDPQPKPRVLTGAVIKDLVKKGALHALRNYRVQPSNSGTSFLLQHLPGKVERVLH